MISQDLVYAVSIIGVLFLLGYPFWRAHKENLKLQKQQESEPTITLTF